MPKKILKKYPNISSLSSEIGTMIEDFQSQLVTVAEQTSRIPKIEKSIDSLKRDVDIIKTDLELMKYTLRIKVDISDFKALERRVALLESRR